MELKDQAIRQRFIGEQGKNFSVIAPAGVGKTTAITQKIASIIRTKAVPLDRLTVVTYTQAAALELQQRTLFEVQRENGDLSAFGHIFFGTIHAFADQLLRKYGHCIGINPDFEIEQNETCLWQFFLQSLEPDPQLSLGPIATLLPPEKFYNLVEKFYASPIDIAPVTARPPTIDLSELLRYPAKSNGNIAKIQSDLRLWSAHPTFSLPKMTTKAREFEFLWERAMAPLEDWCSAACAPIFRHMAEKYEEFRVKRGRLTFSDLIKLSTDLLDNEHSGRLLRRHCVILDEAQDTDAQQFRLLLGVAQHPEARDSDCFKSPPAPGRYCMVGDPQQSIYSERADVSFYQKIHKILTNVGAMEELLFPVTLRFGPQIARHVNGTFCNILDGRDRQVRFTEISSAEEFQPPTDRNPPTDRDHSPGWFRVDAAETTDEVAFLADFFSCKNPANFGVDRWSEVAVLCPRKAWLFEIQDRFSQRPSAPKTQVYSALKTCGECREFSWMRALILLMINPRNSFEFAGILREIFAIADAPIARYCRGQEVPEIAAIGENLKKLSEKCQHLSPLQAIDFLLQTLDLKRRLRAIQKKFSEKIDKILRLGAVRCASLLEFSQHLERQAAEVLREEDVDESALQLYTFHKAKGLEWPVVILPFVNRKQTPAPRILPEIVGGKIAISGRQYRLWADPHGAKNNAERLLYVALTRQKRRTIFVDDGTEPAPYSTAATLQVENINKNLIKNLPLFQWPKETAAAPCSSPRPRSTLLKLPKNFPLKHSYFPLFTPSQSAAVAGEKMRGDGSLAYGNWWHETMKRCPFEGDGTVTFLHSAIRSAPDRDLAQRDVEKLISNDIFWQLIRESEKIFREYPFFTREGNRVFEGRIDLLLKTQRTLHIIDWKTESIGDFDYFFTKHAAQLQHYKAALLRLFPQFFVGASIYSTALGKLFPFQ
ncbi:MAG: UvrD-helicase domain-containing protein [Puniceicoccales bacterium]|jgi:ATP-dependent exoDNAse (exonuclease V) beta subunit|nr:UvrD-helicase domain-containing protein [Puniceicoccales bacterium]